LRAFEVWNVAAAVVRAESAADTEVWPAVDGGLSDIQGFNNDCGTLCAVWFDSLKEKITEVHTEFN